MHQCTEAKEKGTGFDLHVCKYSPPRGYTHSPASAARQAQVRRATIMNSAGRGGGEGKGGQNSRDAGRGGGSGKRAASREK